jgi:heptaprenyl diphosphate synthase
MLVVYLWLIPHAGIAYLIPVFATAALVFGTVNGLIAARFMETQRPLVHENHEKHEKFLS